MKKVKRNRTEKNIRLKVEVWERLKKQAWLERVTLSEMVESLLDEKKLLCDIKEGRRIKG